jgi:neurotransmitter:Na+ symporter, NSS family
MAPERSRSTFSSAWGAMLVTAGVAVGLGNVWRFPYMMGSNGGSAFLLLYGLFVVGFGIPALMAEWALGRHTRRGPWGAFERAGMPGGRVIGVVLLLSVTMSASYYGVVVAEVLQEVGSALLGGRLLRSPELTAFGPSPLAYLALTVGGACGVLAFGVRRGIERASLIALPSVAVVFLVLIVRSLTLPGAAEGLAGFLRPDWSALTPSTALAALGQAAFSLGLGGLFMVNYGSYMRSEVDLPRQAIFTAAADLGAALMAGLIIVPAAFALGVDLESGPGLMFDVMPGVFGAMPAGLAFGAAFFGAVFVVALLSLIAAYEVVVSMLRDALGWSRGRSLVLLACAQFILALPAYLVPRYIEISDLVWGSTMQTLGAAVAVVALAWSVGRQRALRELRHGSTLPVPAWLYHWLKFVLPPAMLLVLVYGWYARLLT